MSDFSRQTPEHICATLGAGEFMEHWRRGLPAKQLKIVLAPSFHVALCLTVGEPDDGSLKVEVATRGAQEVIATPIAMEFEEIERGLRSASPIGARLGLTLDGMRVFIAYRAMQSEVRMEASASIHAPLQEFLAGLVRPIWEVARSPGIRNALANAARYLEIDLPSKEVGAEQVRIGVIGGAEERTELLDALRTVSRKKED